MNSVTPAKKAKHSGAEGFRNPWVKWSALSVVFLLSLVASTAGAIVWNTQRDIKVAEVDELITKRPDKAVNPDDPSQGKALNILVLGSDSREGEGNNVDGVTGTMNSDTAIVMHISGDRSRVDMISIPRDSLVTIPTCLATNGQEVTGSRSAMFNSAFARG